MPLITGPKIDLDIIARFTPTGAEQVIARGVPVPIRAHSDLDNNRVVLSLDTDHLIEAIGDAVIGDPNEVDTRIQVDEVLDRYTRSDSHRNMLHELTDQLEADLGEWDDEDKRTSEARLRLAIACLNIDYIGGDPDPIPKLFSDANLRGRLLDLALRILYITG